MKSQSLELLNKVQALLVEFANREGINLQAEFGTVEKFKTFVISLTIKKLTDMGVEVKDAYDMVLGEGQYDQLISTVWNGGSN